MKRPDFKVAFDGITVHQIYWRSPTSLSNSGVVAALHRSVHGPYAKSGDVRFRAAVGVQADIDQPALSVRRPSPPDQAVHRTPDL